MPNPLPTPRHHFVVIAHRGYDTTFPENMLAAYEQAIREGADYVEIDLRTTKDGQLISLHDATLDRVTTGTGPVEDQSLQQLQQVCVTSPQKQAGVTFAIPTFQQILALCNKKLFVYIDFKEAALRVVYPILRV
ncbi:glycerophosphodiester phosphodiesterase [Hymenobacter sp. BRD67]|uniref:glycerophosphodiester phosphodiesterase n=1 Tax=Hymenobacter sp. BRD67 TaxID=2675877 RepID=UPI0015643941|nr:glycerophosphodiester phosphodiesterase family protein [Hymenobacter sp. BRD67]QKG54274.1 glycerophosphodiester phosphodiesterase family protein [Hymenobacter sp. BRD67]